MTQRLPGISDADATGVAKDTLAGSTKLLGRSSNLLRILSAHTPYLARSFIGFVAAVRQPNVGAVSDVRLRNLATIKTSMTNECKYCATHTSIYGQALGVSEAQLEVMKGDAWGDSPLFNEREKATIAWAERGEQVEHSARNAVGSHQPLDLRCGQPVDMGKRCEEANRAEIQIGPGAMPFVHGCRDGISRPHVATIAPQLSRPIAATFADDSSEIGHPHLYQI